VPFGNEKMNIEVTDVLGCDYILIDDLVQELLVRRSTQLFK